MTTVKEFMEELQWLVDEGKGDMPLVYRRDIGFSGMTNSTPSLNGESTIKADFSDDYDTCRKKMEAGEIQTIEVVTFSV